MHRAANQRIFIQTLAEFVEQEVTLRGWVFRLRVLGKTAFVILKDCSGEAQCVAASDLLKELHLKAEDVIEVRGRVRADERAKSGCELAILEIRVLNRSAANLPFNAASDIESVGLETLIEHRPLALRNPLVGDVFQVQAALLAILSRISDQPTVHGNCHLENRGVRNRRWNQSF